MSWGSGTLIPFNGSRTISNAVTFSSQVAINGANDVTFSGPVFAAASPAMIYFNDTGTTTLAGGMAALNATVTLNGLGVVQATSLLSSGSSSTPSISINGNTLRLAGPNGGVSNTALLINHGSVVLDDTGAAANNNGDRVSATSGVTIASGAFSLQGNAAAASGETLGTLTVGPTGGARRRCRPRAAGRGRRLLFHNSRTRTPTAVR